MRLKPRVIPRLNVKNGLLGLPQPRNGEDNRIENGAAVPCL